LVDILSGFSTHHMSVELPEISDNEDVKSTDQIVLSKESLQKAYILQRCLELLGPIEWKIDLRAQQDLKRCTDLSSILLLNDTYKFGSIRSILETIEKQLDGIITPDDRKIFSQSLLNDLGKYFW
jgi:hypothetical protein